MKHGIESQKLLERRRTMGKIDSVKDRIKEAEGKSRILHFALEEYRLIRHSIRRSRWRRAHNAEMRRLSRMSRAEVFQEIYKNDKWAHEQYKDTPYDFFSGSGSYAEELVGPYVSLLRELISKNEIRTIADLGCGDFNVGRRIAPLVDDYIGCDVVPELIERNKRKFGNDRCSFVCLDMVDDDLPAADLCLIREVLMHLNNREVLQILPKLSQYRYVLITETIQISREGLNEDIVHGRYRGISLAQPPFHMMGTEMLRLKHPHAKESVVVSTLFHNPGEQTSEMERSSSETI